jgi:hypothetical protein
MQCKKSLCLLLTLVVCQAVFGWLISNKSFFKSCPTSLFAALCSLTIAVSMFLMLMVLDQGFRTEEGIRKRILISLFQGKVALAVVGCLAWSDICLLIIMIEDQSHCAEGGLIKKMTILFTLPSLLIFLLSFRILSYYFKYKPFFIRREFHVRQVFLMQQRGSRGITRTASTKRPVL